jgi:NAD(P)-dependent dehydrogenase (short-subunit alcohol dehydrogenase family)
MREKSDLTDKVAVITGGASGLGLALRAAQDGMKVTLADVDECLPAVGVEKLNVRGRQCSGIAVSPWFKVRTLSASIRVSGAQCDGRCERAGRRCVGDAGRRQRFYDASDL